MLATNVLKPPPMTQFSNILRCRLVFFFLCNSLEASDKKPQTTSLISDIHTQRQRSIQFQKLFSVDIQALVSLTALDVQGHEDFFLTFAFSEHSN